MNIPIPQNLRKTKQLDNQCEEKGNFVRQILSTMSVEKKKNSVIRSKIEQSFNFRLHFNMPGINVSRILDSKEVMLTPLSALMHTKIQAKLNPVLFSSVLLVVAQSTLFFVL